MSVPAVLQDERSTILHTETVGPHTHLVVEDHSRVATQYQPATHTTAATSTIVSPRSGGAIVIVDITISGEKINGGTILVRWQDGTRTETVTLVDVTDAPASFHIAYAGRKRGWLDARVELVTNTTNQDATVDVGYYFLRGPGVLSFDDWDTERKGGA